MALLKRMTKKKTEILVLLKAGLKDGYGLAPYIADSISHAVNGSTTNSLTRSMRKTLNTMVDEGLLFKVKLKSEVSINYTGGIVTIDKSVWHYGLIDSLSSEEERFNIDLMIEYDSNIATEEEQALIDVMIDYDNNVISEEDQFNIDLMIEHSEAAIEQSTV